VYKVPLHATVNWYKPTNNPVTAPRAINLACPHCLQPHVTFSLGGFSLGANAIYAVANCPVCQETVKFWIVDPPYHRGADSTDETIILMSPEPPLRAFDERIMEVSPRFVRIYNQAAQAEAHGLDELVGIGYRKALEFLIKDYLCHQQPDKQDEIKKTKQLGTVINNFVSDPNVKEIASRTAWLGNDEAHYVREWEDKDIEDLKQLMQLTIFWVSSSLLTEKLKAEMSRPAKDRA
jgi:hypothetical protein